MRRFRENRQCFRCGRDYGKNHRYYCKALLVNTKCNFCCKSFHFSRVCLSKLIRQSKFTTKSKQSASLIKEKAKQNFQNPCISVCTQTDDLHVSNVHYATDSSDPCDQFQNYMPDTSLPFHSVNNLELIQILNLEKDSIAKLENQRLRKRLQKLRGVNKEKLVVEDILCSLDEQLSDERRKNKKNTEKIDILQAKVKEWKRGYRFEVDLVELMWKHKKAMKKTIVWLENKVWGKSKISAKQCPVPECNMKADRCHICGKQAPGSYCKYCKEKLQYCFEHYNNSRIPWQQEILYNESIEDDDEDEHFPPITVNFACEQW